MSQVIVKRNARLKLNSFKGKFLPVSIDWPIRPEKRREGVLHPGACGTGPGEIQNVRPFESGGHVHGAAGGTYGTSWTGLGNTSGTAAGGKTTIRGRGTNKSFFS